MAASNSHENRSRKVTAAQHGGLGGVWFLGFLGSLAYFLHYHSGTFWLVVMAFVKSVFWMGFLVYYLLRFMRI